VGAYYYFVAQLPSLAYGQEPPMSSVAFRDLAQVQLDAQDAALLDLVGLDPQPTNAAQPAYVENAPSSGCDFIDNWREWERSLRLNLARVRSQRTKREGAAPVDPPVFPGDAVNTAQQASVSAESPLEAEEFLDRARWGAIERLQGIPYFSRNTIYAYLLKLLILERHASFKAEIGFAEYKSLYASILERAQSETRLQGEPK
jgi:hypothetical protein